MSIRLSSISIALLVLACDGESPADPDGSVGRDATLADGGGLFEDAAPRSDAGAHDAAQSRWCQYTECDPRSPDGCADGSCVLWSESSSCEDGSGSLSLGSPCEHLSDCAPGLACFMTAEGGVCGRICCPGDADACTDNAVCAGSGVLVDGTETTWGRCLPPRSCDVLRPQEACEPREGCYIVDVTGHAECRLAGEGTTGDACSEQQDCQAGFFCGGVGSIRRCVRICRIGNDECLSGEGRCVAQAHSPEGTGFCTLDTTNAN